MVPADDADGVQLVELDSAGAITATDDRQAVQELEQ
jgi:hypothetical protein